MWRLNACERLMLPPERVLKRFAALRLVFIFGICTIPVLTWRRVAPTERFPTSVPLLVKPVATLGRNFRFRFLLDFLLDLFFHRLLDFFLALLRRQHHEQLTPFHFRVLLHYRVRFQVLLHALYQPHAE